MSKTFSSPPLPKKKERKRKKLTSKVPNILIKNTIPYFFFLISDNIERVVNGTSSPFSNKLARWKVLKWFYNLLTWSKVIKNRADKTQGGDKKIFSFVLPVVISVFSGATLENMKSISLYVKAGGSHWWPVNPHQLSPLIMRLGLDTTMLHLKDSWEILLWHIQMLES